MSAHVQELSYQRAVAHTIPRDIIGEATDAEEDHGPFYLFSPGQTIHRVDARDSVPHIYPCRVATVTSWGHWRDDEESAPNAVQTRRVRGPQNTMRAQKLNPLFAGATVRDIKVTYGECGVISLQSLARLKAEDVRPDVLNGLLYPSSCEWEFTRDGYVAHVDPRIAEEAQKQGGLAVRLRWVKEARQIVRGSEFANRYGAELQALYSAALAEIEPSFSAFRSYALRELAEAEDLIRRHRGNGVGKAAYDTRDLYFLWLTGREEVDILRGSATPDITVNVPPQPGVDIAAIVAAVTAAMQEQAAAQQAQQQPAKPVQQGQNPAKRN
jgi:hypothetical protein